MSISWPAKRTSTHVTSARVRCFVSQRREVPLGTIGRRAAASSTPATFRRNDSRWYWSSARSVSRSPPSSRGGFWSATWSVCAHLLGHHPVHPVEQPVEVGPPPARGQAPEHRGRPAAGGRDRHHPGRGGGV